MNKHELYNRVPPDSSSLSLRAERVVEEARRLVAKWRAEAARHKKHGDCYRKGQGWGLSDCADELDALLASQEAATVCTCEIDRHGYNCPQHGAQEGSPR